MRCAISLVIIAISTHMLLAKAARAEENAGALMQKAPENPPRNKDTGQHEYAALEPKIRIPGRRAMNSIDTKQRTLTWRQLSKIQPRGIYR